MKFTLFNRRKKTIFSVATAATLALILAGCTAPPEDTEEVPAEDAAPAESSALPNSDAAPEQAAVNADDTATSPNTIAWLSSYNNALQEAKQKNQPIMIDFYADWCTACKVMDKEVYAKPDVIEKSLDFVNLRLDADQETDIVARYKVYALPTLIFLNGDGKVLWRVEGAPTAPYFMETMQKVQDKYTSNT